METGSGHLPCSFRASKGRIMVANGRKQKSKRYESLNLLSSDYFEKTGISRCIWLREQRRNAISPDTLRSRDLFPLSVRSISQLYERIPSSLEGQLQSYRETVNFNSTMKTLDSSKNVKGWNIPPNGNETVSSIVYHARFVLTFLVISTIPVSEKASKDSSNHNCYPPSRGISFLYC